MTESLDILESSRLPPAQARAILRVMETEIAAVREGLATKLDMLELKAELGKLEGSLSRWVLTCMLGQTAALAGLGYFALEHLRR